MLTMSHLPLKEFFMTLDKAIPKLKLDSRLIEINLANGSLKKEELEQYLKSLPDSAGNAEALQIEGETQPQDLAQH